VLESLASTLPDWVVGDVEFVRLVLSVVDPQQFTGLLRLLFGNRISFLGSPNQMVNILSKSKMEYKSALFMCVLLTLIQFFV
jgi:hypothetical protein